MIYRFKIWFEDMEDIVRWIDIQPSHTFFDFHNIIQEAISFDKKEPASFFVSDEKWKRLFEITLEDMGSVEDDENASPKALMKESKLVKYINDPHQRFVYVSDFITMWTMHCEMVMIADEAPKKVYPLIYRTEGKAPRQREDSKFKLLDENEFDALAAKILAAKGARNIMEGAEEEVVADTTADEEEEDEFGFKTLGESTDEEFGMEGFSELGETP
jgi:hypothetical protein